MWPQPAVQTPACAAHRRRGLRSPRQMRDGRLEHRDADQATIAALFDRWNTSLKTLDSHKVTANYASDAVLLATISNKPRTNHAEIDDYFVQFLKIEPSGVIDTRTIKVGCNIAQDVGTYTFSLKGGKKVSARYTYVYQFKDGKWLIAHHHSSAMPETKVVK